MKTYEQAAQTQKQPLQENKTAHFFTCTLCLSIFPLMYIVGKTLVQLFS
ncbi:MAG: hypothetical protein IPJ40_01995 [Saprospirales bacterium]|nr:hypothetical protein [Saprospirales bacterium]